jgi:hypothetical protein
MTEEDNRPDSNTILEALMHAVQHVLRISRFAASGGFDEYGGELYYIYLPPQSDDQIIEYLSDRFESEEEQKVLVELLPTAKRDFDSSLNQKIRQALEDLTQESLFPLYEATGKRYKVKRVEYDSRNSQTKGGRLTKAELKDGVVRHTVLKQPKAGRPPKRTRISLQQKIETAIVAFKLKHNDAPPTMAQIAKSLKISLSALKMRIKREGLQWKELREVT